MGRTLLSGASEGVIAFSGCVDITCIIQVRNNLSEALGRGDDLVLDVGAVTETDLTFVQLVEAARRKATETGASLRLSAPAEGALLEVLQRGGFIGDERSDRSKFWLQGAAQ